MKKILLSGVTLMTVFFSASIQAIEFNDLNWFTSLGYEFGGQKYATGTFINSGVTENAYANVGWHVALGAIVANNPSKTFETQVAIGYKTGGPYGDNSGLFWNAIPLELIEYYRQGDWRTGLGLTYNADTYVSAQSYQRPTQTFRLNGALGYLASVSYAPVAQNYAMELRYTFLKQGFADNSFDQTINGKLRASVFGAFLHYRF
jgi:hypothetical protein